MYGDIEALLQPNICMYVDTHICMYVDIVLEESFYVPFSEENHLLNAKTDMWNAVVGRAFHA